MCKSITKWIENKKGSGELVIVLLLVILGLFFLTKYVFKIPFPFTNGEKVDSGIESQEMNTEKNESVQGK